MHRNGNTEYVMIARIKQGADGKKTKLVFFFFIAVLLSSLFTRSTIHILILKVHVYSL